jgi:hypothetical protein
MLTRYLFLSGLAIGMSITVCNAQAGACDPETESQEHSQRWVDGPANVRMAPNGRVIASIPNKTVVTLIGFQEVTANRIMEIWYHIRWKQGGKTRDGWTHEQNIICD